MVIKVVFTGITGLLGRYFLKNKKKGYEIIGVGNKNVRKNSENFFSIDISRRNLILDFIKKISPQIIVHAASIGNVDYCEKFPDEAYKVNVKGTQNIIKAAKRVNAKIIFLSSNAIYDGNNPPYDEEIAPSPVDIYGKTKVEGENLIKDSNLDYAILRLITMYGWPNLGGRNNPVTWVIESLKKGQSLNVVNDIYNNHLWAGQAAEAVWAVIMKNISMDIFNIAGKDSLSRYDLALKAAKLFKLDNSLISSVSSDFFRSIAKRPKNTTFNTQKMKKVLGIKPVSVEEGLRLMKQESKNLNDI